MAPVADTEKETKKGASADGGVVQSAASDKEPVTKHSTEPVQRGTTKARGTVAPATERATEAVQPLVKRARENVQPVVETAAETVMPVVSAAEPVIDTAEPLMKLADPVVDVVDPIVDPIGPIVDPIVDPIGPIVDPVIDPIVDVVDPIVDVVHPVGPIVLDPVEPVIDIPDPTVDVAPPVFDPVDPFVATRTAGKGPHPRSYSPGTAVADPVPVTNRARAVTDHVANADARAVRSTGGTAVTSNASVLERSPFAPPSPGPAHAGIGTFGAAIWLALAAVAALAVGLRAGRRLRVDLPLPRGLALLPAVPPG